MVGVMTEAREGCFISIDKYLLSLSCYSHPPLLIPFYDPEPQPWCFLFFPPSPQLLSLLTKNHPAALCCRPLQWLKCWLVHAKGSYCLPADESATHINDCTAVVLVIQVLCVTPPFFVCVFGWLVFYPTEKILAWDLCSFWVGEQLRALVAFQVAEWLPLAFSDSQPFAGVSCAERSKSASFFFFSLPRVLVSISSKCEDEGSGTGQKPCFNWSMWGPKELLCRPDLQKSGVGMWFFSEVSW